MSKRCRSWRPVWVEGHSGHLPHQCRECWFPCRNKVSEGYRCSECWEALSEHPDAEVRLKLAEENGTPSDILGLLATDTNPGVALAAQARLENTTGPIVLETHDDEEW